MKIKKSILGISAAAALAGLSLVSCGSSTTYKVELDANTPSVSFGDVETVSATNAKKLLAKLSEITPTKKGYTFNGWYVDEDCTVKLEESTKLSTLKNDEGKYVIYAGFTLNDQTVTLNYGGVNTGDVAGTGTAEVGCKYKDKIETPLPTAPAKTAQGEEYTFVGWYTDAARTEVYDPETEVTTDFTLYAKWDIKQISTAEEFIEYVSESSTVNAVITADIDFTGKTISRLKKDLTETTINSGGTDVTISLNNKVFGRGHELKNITIATDLKLGALWSSLNGGIYDVVFKGGTVNSTQGSTANTAFLAGQVNAKTAVIQDVVFDGIEINTGSSAANVGIVIGQVKGASIDISLDGIVIKNSTINNAGKYVAGLFGLIDKSASGSISVTGLMIDDLEITTASERAALVFGGIGNGGTVEVDINIDGAVLSGSVVGKSTSAIGDNRSTYSKITLKNIVLTDFTVVNSSNTSSDAFITYSSSEAPASFVTENLVYKKWGVSITGTEEGASKAITPKNGTQIDSNTQLATVGDLEYTYDAATTAGTYSITINDVVYTMDVAKDPTEVDCSDAAATFSSTDTYTFNKNVKGETEFTYNENTMIRIASLAIPYRQEAVVGKAGYALQITIAAPSKYTETTGRAITDEGDFYGAKVNADGTISGYIFLTDDELDTLATSEAQNPYYTLKKDITISWFATADEVSVPTVYSVIFQGMSGISKAAKVAPGSISLSTTDTNTGLVASTDATDNTILNLTDGNVDADESGNNYVIVEVAHAAGYTGDVTEDTIKTSANAEVISYTADVATIKVKVNSELTFTVKWNSAWDAVTYTINVTGTAKINKVASGLEKTTVVFSDVTVVTGSNGVTKINDYISLVNGSSKDWSIDANTKSLDGIDFTHRAKSGGSAPYIKIDLSEVSNATVTFTVYAMTGSSSDTARLITVANVTDAEETTTTAGFTTGDKVEKYTFTLKGGSVYNLTVSAAINFYGLILE